MFFSLEEGMLEFCQNKIWNATIKQNIEIERRSGNSERYIRSGVHYAHEVLKCSYLFENAIVKKLKIILYGSII